jgi:hypothetical protein
MINVLFSACAAFFLVDVLQWHKRIDLNMKPFNCVPCLASWLGFSITFGGELARLGIALASLPVALSTGVFTLFFSGCAGLILQGIINKLHS